MPVSFWSSTKMPLPRTRRSSSLRRMGWPTHFAGLLTVLASSFLVLPRRVAVMMIGRAPQSFLQTINQFLHVLLGKRLEHSAGQRSNPANYIRLSEPDDLGRAARRRLQVKSRAQARRAAGHFSPAFINSAIGALRLHQRHLHGGSSANVRNPHAELHQKILVVEYFHALIIRQQRTEALRVHEKVVNLLRRFLNGEVAVELDLH